MLDTFATFMNILASLAVIATLAFIAIQIRQNTAVTRLATAQMNAELLTANLSRIVESADFADLIARDDYTALSAGESLRVTNFLASSFRHFEVLYAHRRTDLFEEELWHGTLARLKVSTSNPRIQDWWTTSRQLYAPSFARFVDELMAEAKAAPDYQPAQTSST